MMYTIVHRPIRNEQHEPTKNWGWTNPENKCDVVLMKRRFISVQTTRFYNKSKSTSTICVVPLLMIHFQVPNIVWVISSNRRLSNWYFCFTSPLSTQDWRERAKTDYHGIRIMCPTGATVVWASADKIQLRVLVKYKSDLIIISLNRNVLSPWNS